MQTPDQPQAIHLCTTLVFIWSLDVHILTWHRQSSNYDPCAAVRHGVQDQHTALDNPATGPLLHVACVYCTQVLHVLCIVVIFTLRWTTVCFLGLPVWVQQVDLSNACLPTYHYRQWCDTMWHEYHLYQLRKLSISAYLSYTRALSTWPWCDCEAPQATRLYCNIC